jgi:hypothetical protein
MCSFHAAPGHFGSLTGAPIAHPMMNFHPEAKSLELHLVKMGHPGKKLMMMHLLATCLASLP